MSRAALAAALLCGAMSAGAALAAPPANVIPPAAQGYVATPEELGRAITAEIAGHPDVLMSLALDAVLEQKRHEQELVQCVLDYFGSHVISMHHAVWVGDHTQEKTAFAFVDYSSVYASVFIKALDGFAHKNNARVLLLPGSMDQASRQAAMLVTTVAHGTNFAPFIAKVQAAGQAYSGKPENYLDAAAVQQADSLANDVTVLDEVALTHLVLVALDMKQPMALVFAGRRYVGNMADSEEMTAFYAAGEPADPAAAAPEAAAPVAAPMVGATPSPAATPTPAETPKP